MTKNTFFVCSQVFAAVFEVDFCLRGVDGICSMHLRRVLWFVPHIRFGFARSRFRFLEHIIEATKPGDESELPRRQETVCSGYIYPN